MTGSGTDRARKWRWQPGQAQLLEAAGCYGSFVSIPTRQESGASLKSADNRPSTLTPRSACWTNWCRTLGGKQEQGGGIIAGFINHLLWDAWQTAAVGLTGQIPLSLLLSRILVRHGRAYDAGDAAANDWAGTRKGLDLPYEKRGAGADAEG